MHRAVPTVLASLRGLNFCAILKGCYGTFFALIFGSKQTSLRGALSAQALIHNGDMDNNLYLSQYYCTDLRLGCSLFRALCIKDSCTFHNVNYGPVFVCPLIMAWLG